MIDSRILNGQTVTATTPITLHWGPCIAVYQNGTLRDISVNNLLVISQIYAAVRDENWGTVSDARRDVQIDQRADSCNVTFRSLHQQGEIDFEWYGTIIGESDGTLRFHFRGTANSMFRRNRIGFCVLHPMSTAGAACRIRHVDGTETVSSFPVEISPHQPFLGIREFHHQAEAGLWVETVMTGDTFEMEDQRNWTDASFKTYCTPLAEPFPVTVAAGTVIEQLITVRLRGTAPATIEIPGRAKCVDIRRDLCPLPQIGLGIADHGEVLSTRAIARLRVLNLAHLRVDLHFKDSSWQQILIRAIQEAKAINYALELALHLSHNTEQDLHALQDTLRQHNGDKPPVARVFIFRDGEKSTNVKWVTMARHILALDAPVGGGTDAYFTELNRERPQAEQFDVVCYSSNPQVHAFDEASLVETLPVVPVTVETARSFCSVKPIAISPITFKSRWNPNATSLPPPTPAGELPSRVDVRQMSLFGATWTLGSFKHLCASDVQALTYFETTGWLGVMERESGSPLPDKFPSIAGGVFPMYHVFADIGEFAGGDSLTTVSNKPQEVDALALVKGNRLRVILANYTPEDQAIVVSGLSSGVYEGRRLDAENALFAMTDPQVYRQQHAEQFTLANGQLQITLPPYGLLTLDSIQL